MSTTFVIDITWQSIPGPQKISLRYTPEERLGKGRWSYQPYSFNGTIGLSLSTTEVLKMYVVLRRTKIREGTLVNILNLSAPDVWTELLDEQISRPFWVLLFLSFSLHSSFDGVHARKTRDSNKPIVKEVYVYPHCWITLRVFRRLWVEVPRPPLKLLWVNSSGCPRGLVIRLTDYFR